MFMEDVLGKVRSAAHFAALCCSLAFAWPLSSLAENVTLVWEPSPDTNVVGYNVYYGTTSRGYTQMVPAGNATSITISNLTEGVTYYFAATAYDSFGLESDYSEEASYTVPFRVLNYPPTLDPLASFTILENAAAQSVPLTGISSGSTTESQVLVISATSSNPGLIPSPTISYTSPDTIGTLTFAPTAFASGTATITVTVNDGGSTNNLVSQAFVVTVADANQPPTLAALANLSVAEDSGVQTVNLTGISSGAANESQTLTVTASSSAPALIPNPAVTYTSPASTGSLKFTPAANANGSAIITVTVKDGGTSNNVVSRTFTVSVNPVNDPPTLATLSNITVDENSAARTVNLSGISSGATNENQNLSVTATSSNPALIPAPTVNYSSPSATGTLSFTPVSSMSGTATITVTVNDGQSTANTVSQSFVVTVAAINQIPTLDAIANLTIGEDSGLQTVNLTGISSGAANESQTLTVTASSSAPTLIPNPTVTYTSPASTGSLKFTPAANANGSAIITVTVKDGGTSNNVVSQTFTVTVNPVNDPPTLAALSNITVDENSAAKTVNLSGISSGATNENQNLSVTATSSNPALIPAPTVNYSSPSATGTLSFTPVSSMSGTATITVTVNDGQSTANTVSQSFVVTVAAINQIPTLDAIANLTIGEDPGLQTVNLTGISSGAANESQTLTVTASSSAPALIPNPTVTYTSPASTGSLKFTPAANANGSAIITVTVKDGGTSNNVVSRTFTVTVNPR